MYHVNGNDDIPNGLALCKTHHWLFHKGLLTVSSHYRVMVSGQIEVERPEGVVSGLRRREIILPGEARK